MMRSSLSKSLLTCVAVLAATTFPSDTPMAAAQDAEDEPEFITLFEQPAGLGPHEAIAPLSSSSLGAEPGDVPPQLPSTQDALEVLEAVAGPDVRTTNSAGTQAEISMAATAGGQNIVLAYNGGPQGLGITSSQNGGQTFGAEFSAPTPAGSNPCCDPSVVGDAANSFYLIQLYRDDGANTPAAGNCTNSLHISNNGGATFGNIVSSPFSYAPGSGQFPDQPHIGIDRANPGPNLYVTTRHFTTGVNCPQTGGGGTVQGEIVCSNDGGATWSNPLVWPQFTDTAHIGVGSDGRTYVAGMGIGTNPNTTRVILWRSTGTTCPGAGNTPAFTGPTVVADNLTFAASGIDREFVQPDVIVDPTNSNRVFVSYSADSTQGSGDRDVFLATCLFPAGTCTPVTINDNPGDGTPQYFVMTCIDPVSNAIYASWTDARALPNHQIRAATITNNGATVSASQQVSDVTWPIINPPGTPDYGDYNENNSACRANHHYAAWTSQISPPGVFPPSTDLDVFFTVVNDPPVASAGGPYVTSEGSDVALNANATDTENDTPFVFEWDFNGDGLFDDATGPTPLFSDVGQDGSFPVCVRVSDSIGDSDEDCSTVTVTNVAPVIVTLGNSGPDDEGVGITVSGLASDPGFLDVLTATVDWGDGSPVEAMPGLAEQNRPDATLNFSGTHVYGDNGVFSVEVCVADDDVEVCDQTSVTIDNVDPTVVLGAGAPIVFPGGTYSIAVIGEDAAFSATSTDPGSDDLTFTWSFGRVATYFNDGVGPDPFPSPLGLFPFAATDDATFTFVLPGAVVVTVIVVDDDGGSVAANAALVVIGNAVSANGLGWWKHQFSGAGRPHIDPALSDGYLDVVEAVSSVFSEAVAISNASEAHEVLSPTGSDRRARARAELLLAWLHFASGAVPWDATVPLGGGETIGFLPLMFEAELVILDPASSNKALGEVERKLQQVRHAG